MKKPPISDNNERKPATIVEITANGSLGLLALGAVGVKAWKKKRKENQSTQKNNQEHG